MLTAIITATDPAVRDTPLARACAGLSYRELLAERGALDRFRRDSANLYDRVRALCFLYAIDRFHLPARPELPAGGHIPRAGVEKLLSRRFDEAIRLFRAEEAANGPGDPLCSALAAAYQALAFQTLADQVRASVRRAAGNRWMFRAGSADEHPLRVRPELRARPAHRASAKGAESVTLTDASDPRTERSDRTRDGLRRVASAREERTEQRRTSRASRSERELLHRGHPLRVRALAAVMCLVLLVVVVLVPHVDLLLRAMHRQSRAVWREVASGKPVCGLVPSRRQLARLWP